MRLKNMFPHVDLTKLVLKNVRAQSILATALTCLSCRQSQHLKTVIDIKSEATATSAYEEWCLLGCYAVWLL
jgi:hypothetical protein